MSLRGATPHAFLPRLAGEVLSAAKRRGCSPTSALENAPSVACGDSFPASRGSKSRKGLA
jgi:hypothetical protein